jgi:hypothetical protein
MMLSENEIIERIRELFDLNYEMLRLEGGHALTEDVKQMALNQIIYYYKRMRDVAEQVTETEVKLTLPEQKTSQGRNFTIQGIVDIVREDEETWLYDIKTHDLDYIHSNIEFYEKQLDIYAFIWQQLRGEKLDHAAVISTALPNSLKDAIQANDPKRIQHEMSRWQPLVKIPFKKEKVDETIADFGKVVDAIEAKQFQPAPIEKLKTPVAGTKRNFGSYVCRNCDARFSCLSYLEFVAESKIARKVYFEDFGSDAERQDWANANLEVTDFGKFEIE